MEENLPDVCHLTAKTWYGIPVEIIVSSNNLHKVSVPGVTIPHPGLVNMIVRQGYPVDIRLALTARHEFGHLQTIPIPLLHLSLLLWLRQGQPSGSRWLRLLVELLTHQAVWEVTAEGYAVATDKQVFQTHRSQLSRILYTGFWGIMAAVSIFGTIFLLRRGESIEAKE